MLNLLIPPIGLIVTIILNIIVSQQCTKILIPGALRDYEDPFVDFVINEFFLPFAEAQSTTIGKQLRDGSRWFDLRLYKAGPDVEEDGWKDIDGNYPGGKFYAHHTLTALTPHTTIFKEIAEFVSNLEHEDEIFFLRFKKPFGQKEGSDSNRTALTEEMLSEFLETPVGTGGDKLCNHTVP